MVIGLVLFAATILALRRRGVGVLERYRYTIAAVGIGMTVLPRLPVIGEQVNGAYLDIHVGGVSFQPAELGKVAIVIFLASYLRDNRQILVTGGRRILGLTIPPMKQFGPMLLVWGAAMGTLLLTGELGTSLMFYGAFLALLYVATGRFSFPLIGLVLFALGAWFVAGHVEHVHARVLAWEHPLDPALFRQRDQLPARPSAVRAGRRRAARHGLRPVAAAYPVELASRDRARSILPVPESDMIYAVITDELGLVGAAGLLLVYLLFVARGLKTAMLAKDSFSKLLATGLSFVVAMQVFVIVGGVTRVIPLTGVTLPFVAYGGSSVVMNFVLLALLLVSPIARGGPTHGPDVAPAHLCVGFIEVLGENLHNGTPRRGDPRAVENPGRADFDDRGDPRLFLRTPPQPDAQSLRRLGRAPLVSRRRPRHPYRAVACPLPRACTGGRGWRGCAALCGSSCSCCTISRSSPCATGACRTTRRLCGSPTIRAGSWWRPAGSCPRPSATA